jgi:hypothetical protein
MTEQQVVFDQQRQLDLIREGLQQANTSSPCTTRSAPAPASSVSPTGVRSSRTTPTSGSRSPSSQSRIASLRALGSVRQVVPREVGVDLQDRDRDVG